jgi:hypothetical protein
VLVPVDQVVLAEQLGPKIIPVVAVVLAGMVVLADAAAITAPLPA